MCHDHDSSIEEIVVIANPNKFPLLPLVNDNWVHSTCRCCFIPSFVRGIKNMDIPEEYLHLWQCSKPRPHGKKARTSSSDSDEDYGQVTTAWKFKIKDEPLETDTDAADVDEVKFKFEPMSPPPSPPLQIPEAEPTISNASATKQEPISPTQESLCPSSRRPRLVLTKYRKEVKSYWDKAGNYGSSVLRMPNLPSILLKRQLGLSQSHSTPNKASNDTYGMLFLSRAARTWDRKRVEEPITYSYPFFTPSVLDNGQSQRRPIASWIQTPMTTIGSPSKQLHADVIEDYLVIREAGSNTRHFYTLKPYCDEHPFELKFTLTDTDPDPKKWIDSVIFRVSKREFDVSSGVSDHFEFEVLKYSDVLVVLERCKLVLYALQTGKKFHERSLASCNAAGKPLIYKDVSIQEGSNLISISSSERGQGQTNKNKEILLFRFPSLQLKHKITMRDLGGGSPKGVCDIKVAHEMLVLQKSSSCEFYDLNETLEMNQSINESVRTEETVISKLPEQLLILPGRSGSFFMMNGIWPPVLCLETAKEFEIRPLETLGQCLYRNSIHEERERVTADFFPLKNAPRIYFYRETGGLKVVNLKHNALHNADNDKRLEFTSDSVVWKNEPSTASTANTSTTQRSTSRCLRKKVQTNYTELDKVIVHGVDCHRNFIVICKVEDETLYTAIFDESAQFKKVLSLPEVKIPRPRKWRVDCSEMQVRLTTTCLYVFLTLYDDAKSTGKDHMYSINLLGEDNETLEKE